MLESVVYKVSEFLRMYEFLRMLIVISSTLMYDHCYYCYLNQKIKSLQLTSPYNTDFHGHLKAIQKMCTCVVLVLFERPKDISKMSLE